eukprot:TRINITY_DN14919_c0_g1_i1.p1 TRINITY_DN14919_c0_g1~~TRINITY_DN14919_c0_g1_i1.p1  ORF type:complete len:226 (+),score=31.82 TRINITY_DN14919_c0_g1_i1:44-721(+)
MENIALLTEEVPISDPQEERVNISNDDVVLEDKLVYVLIKNTSMKAFQYGFWFNILLCIALTTVTLLFFHGAGKLLTILWILCCSLFGYKFYVEGFTGPKTMQFSMNKILITFPSGPFPFVCRAADQEYDIEDLTEDPYFLAPFGTSDTGFVDFSVVLSIRGLQNPLIMRVANGWIRYVEFLMRIKHQSNTMSAISPPLCEILRKYRNSEHPSSMKIKRKSKQQF